MRGWEGVGLGVGWGGGRGGVCGCVLRVSVGMCVFVFVIRVTARRFPFISKDKNKVLRLRITVSHFPVSARTGCPGVNILSLRGIARLTCNSHLGVASWPASASEIGQHVIGRLGDPATDQ